MAPLTRPLLPPTPENVPRKASIAKMSSKTRNAVDPTNQPMKPQPAVPTNQPIKPQPVALKARLGTDGVALAVKNSRSMISSAGGGGGGVDKQNKPAYDILKSTKSLPIWCALHHIAFVAGYLVHQ